MPEGTNAGQIEFEDDFASPELQRGKDYWKRGSVSVERADDTHATATVHVGAKDYTVSVDLSHGAPITSCTCDADTQYCRHAAAALYAVIQGDAPKHSAPESVERAVARSTTELVDIPHEMYDGLIRAIVEKHDTSGIDGDGADSFTLIWTNEWTIMPAPLAPADSVRLFTKTKVERLLKESLTEFTTPAQGQSKEDKAEELRKTPIDKDSCDKLFTGVHQVLENALRSTDWEAATRNICTVIRFMADATQIFNDSKDVARSHAHALLMPVTRYMSFMSEEASPDVSGSALGQLTKLATNDLVMHVFSGGIPLFSCALPFARWDDTSMWAYEAMDTADKAIGTDVSEDACQKRGFDIPWARRRLTVLRRDVAALSRDGLTLKTIHDTNPTSVTFLTIDLASAMLRGDLEAATEVLKAVNKLNDGTVTAARDANNDMLLALNINPKTEFGHGGWLSVTEAVMQARHDTEGLKELYTNNILNATPQLGIRSVPRMHKLVGDKAWPAERRELATECARQMVRRKAMLGNVNEQITKQGKKPIPSIALRNPAYELLLMQVHDADAALEYIKVTGAVSKELLDVVAESHPTEAATIADKLHEAQIARGEEPTPMISSDEYTMQADADAAADAVDAILDRPAKG
ncbi:MAG: hypothetical protein PUF97_04195 [Bifidobacteriaceae bacterium]|nr:hypothetical protein [Bifidobacteriaceae bacterium]